MGNKWAKPESEKCAVTLRKKGDMWIPVPGETTLQSHGYIVDRTISNGQFSKIKLAHCNTTNQKVVIKFISKKRAPSEIAEKFFYREVEMMKKVRGHPYIVALYDVIESESNIYVVMEYARHGDLLDYINIKSEYSVIEKIEVYNYS
ncbi:testis-specific serine/threonine-protein kinase 4-like [Glandiceps talaboti]